MEFVTRRTSLRLAACLAVLVALVGTGQPLAAHDDEGSDEYFPPVGYTAMASSDVPAPDWIFPVVGTDGVDFAYYDTFGAPRGSGRVHHGVDIGTYGVKGVPVVAAADGVVRYVNWSSDPTYLNPDRCCTIALDHADGWATWYIHLDNDTPGTDDGLGWGIAPGILPGVEVSAGQLIGWVGDSGNAENTYPHLHWEVHAPGGIVVNPTPHADAALRIQEVGAVNAQNACPDGSLCDTIVTIDDDTGLWTLWSDLTWGAAKESFYFGNPGDVPFMGDWNGDGTSTPGLYRQSDGYVYLRNENSEGVADIEFFFGDPGDFPLVGDFDGDGRDSVSIWRASEARVYVINELGTQGQGLGVADYSYEFGNRGDMSFVGDFDGDGVDTVGLYRQSTGFVYFRNSNTPGTAELEFFYGDPGDQVLVGDWNGDGDDTVAVYRPSTSTIHLNFENRQATADWSGHIGSHSVVLTATVGPQP
ncbi:MAG TPA: M23 family metallopeptidase [Acidimicrobiia bacterium]|nr:M23 family metallopeptidase [Acidimicrobiia bacterium]